MHSFIEVIKKHSIYQGNSIAIASNNDSIDFCEFYRLICFARQYLQHDNEKNVILKEEDPFQFSINFFALLLSDKVIIPVGMDISHEEMEELVKDTDSTIFEDNILDLFRENKADISDTSTMELSNAGIIHRTSGSTSAAKYCIRSLESLTKEAINFQSLYEITPDDRVLSLCPLHHSFALGAALLTSVYSGSCLYTISKFSPKKAVKQIAADLITYLVMVPDIAHLLCLANKDEESGYHIRIPLVGAGLTTIELFHEFKDKFNSIIKCNYGSTETGAVMSGSDSTPISSVGAPLSCVQVKLKDDNGREIVSMAAQGDLYVKSEAMLSGYLHRKLELDEEGYYFMGDIVRRDESGNYFIVGRKKPIIKIAGVTVNLAEVERVIRQYPGVRDCIVYANKTKASKEVLYAMLAGIDIDEYAIRSFCSTKLPSACVPSKFYIGDKLERNELGKIKVKL